VLEGHATPHVRFSDHFEGPVKPLLEAACKQGLEGLIGKRANAPYTSTRSTSWVKIKCSRRQEFVVVGHTDPKGSRTGFGSLLLAIHDEKTGKLRYAGNVGTASTRPSSPPSRRSSRRSPRRSRRSRCRAA
jgi:bifunctional non-homologous end joining protein LigD